MKRKNIELTKTKSTVANEANLLPTKHKRRLQETYSVEPRVSRRIPLPAREQKKKKKEHQKQIQIQKQKHDDSILPVPSADKLRNS